MDVTSSCKSPMNTGVQRVVRELFRSLARVVPVTPLIWDPGLRSYCTLSRRERGFLENPFRKSAADADAEPGRRANPIPVWSKLVRRLVHRRNRLDLAARLTAADAFFVPEIFQDNRLAFFPALAGASPARRVVMVHDLVTVRRPDLTPGKRQAGFAEYLECLGTFDHVVAISRETADDLAAFWREHRQRAAPVSVCHLSGVHAGETRPFTPLPTGAARPSILCVGTFEPRKNHLVLLTAAAQLWARGIPFELVLVGRTTPGWGARVEAAVSALQAAGRPVRWLRHVDDGTLHRAYTDCAFTVFPTVLEGFGLPILESLWHGRPCVCGTNGALGEVSAGGGCLAVDQSNPATLASAMERLLTNPPFLAQLHDQTRDRPFTTWETVVQTLLPLL